MQNARLDEAQAAIKITRRNTNIFRYADDTTLMAESDEELKRLLMRVKEDSEKKKKNWLLKLSTQKVKIMASDLTTSWEIEGIKVEAVTDLLFGTLKSLQMVTEARKLKDACSLEGKLTNLDSILKSKERHHFAKKGLHGQSYGFSSSRVWM